MKPEEADRIIALIKGEIEEPDAGDYPDEDELISDQEDLMDEGEELEDEDEYRPLPHTMDTHSLGSFIYTGIGFGIRPRETTLTRFTERKKR